MPVQFSSLPVTLGVTGHRDVQDTEQLLALLESEISAIQARYPHSPVMALSSLAEGADRLFARVIMEKDYRCMWCCLLPKKSTSVTSPTR